MKLTRFPLFFLIFSVGLAACATPLETSPPRSNLRPGEFPVAPAFEKFYEVHGGVEVIGPAISPELDENGLRVQYFLNGRLEYHPANPAGLEVLLSPLGLTTLGASEPPVPPPPLDSKSRYFAATGHFLYAEFEPFFDRIGGIEFIGYPISEVRVESGRVIQYFERGAILRPESSSTWRNIRLAALGFIAYPAQPAQGLSGFMYATPPAPVSRQPFRPYLDLYIGGDIVGPPLTNPVPLRDGTMEQVYRNAILYSEPGAPGGVRLRPLGRQFHPALDPPVPPLNTPGSRYFPATGHNVTHVFGEAFRTFGGLTVFGNPLNEEHLEGNMLVQDFENARMEWRFGVPNEAAFQLTNYGEQALALPAPTPIPTVNANLLMTPRTRAEYPALDFGFAQTIYLRVVDSAGQPVAGAGSVLAVRPTRGGFITTMPPTDTDGRTQFTFGLPDTQPGDFVLYEIAITAPDRPPAYLEDSFITSSIPATTAP